MRRLHLPRSHGQTVCHLPTHCHLRAELLQYAAGWNAGAPVAKGGADSDEADHELLDRCGVELPTRDPPDEVGDAEEPGLTSELQQGCPEVEELGVALSDGLGLGDAKADVVGLGVAVSDVVELGLAVSEGELCIAMCDVLDLGDAEPEVVKLGVAVSEVVELDLPGSEVVGLG